MKTILVLTDFSIRAQYAAEYAMQMAFKSGADLILCNAIELAEHNPVAQPIAWPVAGHLSLQDECMMDLKYLANHLKSLVPKNQKDALYEPTVTCIAGFGKLTTLVSGIIPVKGVDLIVMGAHKSNGLARFLFDSHTHDILDNIDCPVLMIPGSQGYKGINLIAYGTDLTFSNKKVIQYLSEIAEPFNAEILVRNILPPNVSSDGQANKILADQGQNASDSILTRITYTSIQGENIPKSLLEISGAGKADILALVHKRYGFFENLFHSSISKRMVDIAEVPLLVLPGSFSENVGDLSDDQLDHYCYEPGRSRG
ncbi:universal stress protein [Desertivirga xinjiangensis]|uniref:universal stress protein n=1 Tax=Desertivirga xinjiangensis TaxID=539206 RepID=UPI002108D1C7|nr:universal stress protein [Pedobacter xinjiangensis]